MAPTPTATLLDELSDRVHAAVRSVITPGSTCALLGYPNHTNPGDHAIWTGATAVLERIGAEITYACAWRDYSRDALEAAVAFGARIVFTGGGNFGDVWPATHALRETVLRDFVGVPIVQLPQTVHFIDAENLETTRRLLHRHGNVVLLVRDAPSLDRARKAFELGIPTVITDTRYGKLRATFDTFTHAAPLAQWAATPEHALAVAAQAVPRSSR